MSNKQKQKTEAAPEAAPVVTPEATPVLAPVQPATAQLVLMSTPPSPVSVQLGEQAVNGRKVRLSLRNADGDVQVEYLD